MESQIYEREKKARNVIIYELNEVPWEIVDLYVKQRPKSYLARLIQEGSCLTTVNEDPIALKPWRTWSTFHKSMYTNEHNSFDLGQDPATFRGNSIWEIAEANELSIGLFGVLQSWPPHKPKAGGFYVPDTFSKQSEAFPESLSWFQEFNLRMTKNNGFSAESNLNPRQLVTAGLKLVNQGLSPYSIRNTCLHLVKERLDRRYKAGRSILQVLPCFDLYWKLHLKHKPNLSIFFTNHVAGMMHRFWGDLVPRYLEEFDYTPNRFLGDFIIEAMDRFDHQIGTVIKFVAKNPDTILIVASSMGQGSVPKNTKMEESYVVRDVGKFASELNLGEVEEGMHMYPRTALNFPDDKSMQKAIAALQTVTTASGLKFYNFRTYNRSLIFSITSGSSKNLSEDVCYSPLQQDSNALRQGKISDLGIAIQHRPGGGNTGHHIPEGIFISYGAAIEPNSTREKMSLLDVAPSILKLLGLSKSQSMRGKAEMVV